MICLLQLCVVSIVYLICRGILECSMNALGRTRTHYSTNRGSPPLRYSFVGLEGKSSGLHGAKPNKEICYLIEMRSMADPRSSIRSSSSLPGEAMFLLSLLAVDSVSIPRRYRTETVSLDSLSWAIKANPRRLNPEKYPMVPNLQWRFDEPFACRVIGLSLHSLPNGPGW
ncbi:uncharacterized protein BDW43DRAFT_179797 [Aspergillus alliaceus]|uniref:uncharacterized protein n=1 Tax=Petromyces alliaceus TaxID=209559 RepID=UPI0012A42F7C|nr:uncharacterized protein BDW43DRAFT_179797 [Aspergillus alliaceus]KAB8237568.1 hypothetical protein BDW43DRAFT_179797 [Aspergillus alliaceus]